MEVGALLLPPAMVAEALTPAAVALLRESPVQLSIQARTEPGAPAPLHPAFDLKRARRSVSRWRPGSSAATGCRRGVRQQAGRDVRGSGAGRGAGRGRPRERRAVSSLMPELSGGGSVQTPPTRSGIPSSCRRLPRWFASRTVSSGDTTSSVHRPGSKNFLLRPSHAGASQL